MCEAAPTRVRATLAPPEPPRSRLEPWLAWTAALLPAAVALWRATGSPQWRGDLPALRDQGLAAIGVGGTLSTALTQLAAQVPLGPMSFRAALAAAFALSGCAFFLFRIARRLLGAAAALSPWLVSLLAGVAAVMATMSASFQREATVGGGAVVAALCAIAAIDRAMDLTEPSARTLLPRATGGWLLLAALCGATLAESLVAGLATLIVVAFMALSAGKRPPLRMVPAMLVVTALLLALAQAPQWLRPLAPRSWSDVGHALSAASLDAMDVDVTRKTALIAWIDEVGLISLGLAAAGLIVGVWRQAQRAWMSAIVGLVVLDLAYPLSAAPRLGVEPLAALRALAVGALAIAAALGVAEAVAFLRNTRLPMARTASVLMVVFHVTVVAVACEEAAFAADRSRQLAADEWTDTALEDLPPGAALLVHSAPLAWRLWCAQSLSGQRPDVIVIPAPLLQHGDVTANLIPSAPEVKQVLRDYALSGQASEYSLSLLADARPLMVEIDPKWDARTLSHLTIEGAWLRFAPQVMGTYDRKIGAHALAPESRVAARFPGDRSIDEPTVDVVVSTLREHAATLALVGMSADAMPLLDAIERFNPGDPFVLSARLRIAHAEREHKQERPVALVDLLRF